jgi:hypothetical protein
MQEKDLIRKSERRRPLERLDGVLGDRRRITLELIIET